MMRHAQLRDLFSGRFLREIHHLLWMESCVSGDVVDAGWNCRDHAWATALLAQSLGHNVALVNGEAFFAKGPAGSSPGVSFAVKPHSWMVIEGVGAIDLSIKPASATAGDVFRLPITCIFANEWIPRGRSKAYFVDDAGQFARAVAGLPGRRNQVAAVYLAHEAEHLHDGHLTRAAGWIASPLTKRLDFTFGNPSDLYATLLLHLNSFLDGSARSYTDLPFDEAWRRLAEVRGGAIDRARQFIVAGAERRLICPEPARQLTADVHLGLFDSD